MLIINRCSISDGLDRFAVGLLSALVEESIACCIGLEEEVEGSLRRGRRTEHVRKAEIDCPRMERRND